jgi:hypothetical protein
MFGGVRRVYARDRFVWEWYPCFSFRLPKRQSSDNGMKQIYCFNEAMTSISASAREWDTLPIGVITNQQIGSSSRRVTVKRDIKRLVLLAP